MKLVRKLTMSNAEPHVINERVVLQQNRPGRALFLIHSPNLVPQINNAVAFDIGYTQQSNSQRLFLGYIEKVTPSAAHQYHIFCRELSAVLINPLPMNLRHVKLKDVLNAISEKTGLNFSIPDQKYSQTLIANFFNLGNGYQAMKQIGLLFKIPDYIWQQQAKGIIYVGSWDHSRWSEKPISLPENIFSQQNSQNSVKVLAIPALRPGVMVNDKRIENLEFVKQQMEITWKKA